MYRGIRHRALQVGFGTADAFDAAVRAQVGTAKSPIPWVRVAQKITIPCPKCKATGIYQWGAKMEYSGPCFACGGTGHQNDADWRRNWGYWTREDTRASIDPFYNAYPAGRQ